MGVFFSMCVSVCVHMLFSLRSCCGCSHIRSAPALITKDFLQFSFSAVSSLAKNVPDFYQYFCMIENVKDLTQPCPELCESFLSLLAFNFMHNM